MPAGGAAAAAAAAKRKPGEAGAGVLLDEDGALAIVQWVLSATPDAAVAEQQLKDAWSRVRLGLKDCHVCGPLKMDCGCMVLLGVTIPCCHHFCVVDCNMVSRV